MIWFTFLAFWGQTVMQRIQEIHFSLSTSDGFCAAEAQITLSQAVTYVASAPKSNAACMAVFQAADSVKNVRTTVPPHLQDSHYKGAAKLGHGVGYKYAHDYPNHYVEQQYLPTEILGSRFYEPTENGYEKNIKDHLDRIRKGK